ncbi:MAG TPA: nucleotidyltransferase domain-containing protein [Gemmatimonadaceae bacterium]|nr:nucleotidyltransferase domain-containing protein [Gemmatimonadaceae bacterium]
MTLDELVGQLTKAYGGKLSSVVLYGSAAGGDHVPNRSDYNILVLLDSFDGSQLDESSMVAASHVARAWKEAGNPPPMTLTREEWQRSSDIFPMEYADILERHRVLYGEPPFEGIQVSKADLRLQLEQQVMGKLLQLRQGAVLAGTDAKRRIELVAASLSTMMVLFRAVLRLHGERPEGDNAAIAGRVGALAGFDAAPFARAVRHVRGAEKIPAADAGKVLAGYLTAIDRLSRHLDRFEPT